MPIETALSVGLSGLFTEHLFSTGLTSFPTTSEFFKEKPTVVRKTYVIISIASLVFVLFMCGILKNWWGVGAWVGLCLFFIVMYELAMRGKLD